MTTSPSPPSFNGITIRDAANKIACCVRTVRKAIAAGRLPAYRLGSRIFLKPEDVEAFIQNRAVPITPDETAQKKPRFHDMKADNNYNLGDAAQGDHHD